MCSGSETHLCADPDTLCEFSPVCFQTC